MRGKEHLRKIGVLLGHAIFILIALLLVLVVTDFEVTFWKAVEIAVLLVAAFALHWWGHRIMSKRGGDAGTQLLKYKGAAPAINLMMLVVFAFFDWPLARLFAGINGTLVLIYLIPAKPFDGAGVFQGSKPVYVLMAAIAVGFLAAVGLQVPSADLSAFFTSFFGIGFLIMAGGLLVIVAAGLVGVKVEKAEKQGESQH